MKRSKFLTACLALGWTLSAQAATVIDVNGDFEDGVVGFHNYAVSSELGSLNYGPPTFGVTMPTGWVREGTRSWMVSDLGAPGYTFPSGDYAARLDNNSVGGADAFRFDGITIGGVRVFLTLDLWRTNTGSSPSFFAELDDGGGNVFQLLGPSGVDITAPGNYTFQAPQVPSHPGTYSLRIYAEQTGPDNNHIFVDNLVLTAVAYIPEPDSLALALVGGLLVTSLRKRKSRR